MNEEEKKDKAENTDEKPEKKQIEPISESASALQIVESLLKTPMNLVIRFQKGGAKQVISILLATAALCLLAYGVVTGSFSGGIQWWASPVKITCGMLLAALFCFPSFFIFSCLSGIDIKLSEAAGILIAGITLTSILLIGFAPVAWVFSQSTNSVFFMGFFHILFWGISTVFGMRIIFRGLKIFNVKNPVYLLSWMLIFIITSLQMMTAVRPLIGTAKTLLPTEKKFFIQNWANTLQSDLKKGE